MLPWVPWLCAYCPVRNVAREGQQSGYEANAFVNVAPRLPISRSTDGNAFIIPGGWSSVITTTKFGRDVVSPARPLNHRGEPSDRDRHRGERGSEVR